MLANERPPKKWNTFTMELTRFSIETTQEEKEYWNNNVRKPYVQAMLDCLDSKFPPDQDTVLASLSRVFDCAFLSSDVPEDYDNDLKTIHQHYKSILPEKAQDLKRLQREYGSFLLHVDVLNTELKTKHDNELEIDKDAPAVTSADIAAEFLTREASKSLPAVTLLLLIALSLPVASAEAERAFSAMNRIKDKERANLGQPMLQSLMQISKNGKHPDEFDYSAAVVRWYRKGTRKEELSDLFLSQFNAGKSAGKGNPK